MTRSKRQVAIPLILRCRSRLRSIRDPRISDLGVAVEPLFSQHGDKRRDEGGQARVKDGLDVDNNGIGAAPLRESSICAGRNVPKRDIGNNLEESEAHLIVIWLEIALNVDDESGCNPREQTGLYAHKNQRTP